MSDQEPRGQSPPHVQYGWLLVELHLGWKHRLSTTLPMAFLGLIDNAVALVTLGFVQPGMALAWGFRPRDQARLRRASDLEDA